MVEGLLAGVAVTALNEGVKFLYNQAAEALKRWRERGDAVLAEPPESVFEPGVGAVALPAERVGGHERQLRELMNALQPYVAAGEQIQPTDVTALHLVHTLRRVMEQLTGQTLTFHGEQRDTRLSVRGAATADHVDGTLRGVGIRRAGSKLGGASVDGIGGAKTVGKDGNVTGVEIGDLG
jgi:hypothetical protein